MLLDNERLAFEKNAARIGLYTLIIVSAMLARGPAPPFLSQNPTILDIPADTTVLHMFRETLLKTLTQTILRLHYPYQCMFRNRILVIFLFGV